MGQTPFPFVLGDEKIYDKKGAKEVWAQSRQCGLDKGQAIVQLTIFADWVDRVRVTVNFQGKSLPISAKEKQSYDRRITVMYQEKAWCDQEIMKK